MELPDDTDLLMHCMLLAFQYYPRMDQLKEPPLLGDNHTAAVAQRLLNSTADDARAHGFGAYVTTATNSTATTASFTTVHPSYAAASNARDFIADCTRASPQRPYDLPWELKALWAFLFAGMLLVAIVGNCIVIWIVLGKDGRTVGVNETIFCIEFITIDIRYM